MICSKNIFLNILSFNYIFRLENYHSNICASEDKVKSKIMEKHFRLNCIYSKNPEKHDILLKSYSKTQNQNLFLVRMCNDEFDCYIFETFLHKQSKLVVVLLHAIYSFYKLIHLRKRTWKLIEHKDIYNLTEIIENSSSNDGQALVEFPSIKAAINKFKNNNGSHLKQLELSTFSKITNEDSEYMPHNTNVACQLKESDLRVICIKTSNEIFQLKIPYFSFQPLKEKIVSQELME